MVVEVQQIPQLERLVRVGNVETSGLGFADGAVEVIRTKRVAVEDAPSLIIRWAAPPLRFGFLHAFEPDRFIHQA